MARVARVVVGVQFTRHGCIHGLPPRDEPSMELACLLGHDVDEVCLFVLVRAQVVELEPRVLEESIARVLLGVRVPSIRMLRGCRRPGYSSSRCLSRRAAGIVESLQDLR